MFNFVRTRVLQIFRVPHDPDPPAGASGSVRVFRAAGNFYKLRLLRWAVGQLGALAGILFSLNLLEQLQQGVEEVRVEVRQATGAATSPIRPAANASNGAGAESPGAPRSKAVTKSRPERGPVTVRRIAERWPWWLFPLLTVVEWVGVGLYILQIPLTYAIVRLDYELRWYIVTDRSLRIRAGVAVVQETTMSFANVQQVVVSQGPVQRLLGIADLRVQSAGGGGDQHEHGGGDSLHTGVFHGIDNANQIRDLIQERLRAFRQAGLGDPDDAHVRHVGDDTPPMLSATAPSTQASPSLIAAQELLQEARALRQALL